MRDMLDTLTRGPFRDDTHRAAVEAAAEDLGQRQLRGNSPHVPDAPAEPVGGEIKAEGRVMRVEAEDGRVRARNPIRKRKAWTPAMDAEQTVHALDTAIYAVGQIYAAAASALSTAAPLPLASTEPWSETDQAYRARLSDYLGYDVTYSGSMLDDYGIEAAELPRLRLVPATTMQGEQA